MVFFQIGGVNRILEKSMKNLLHEFFGVNLTPSGNKSSVKILGAYMPDRLHVLHLHKELISDRA